MSDIFIEPSESMSLARAKPTQSSKRPDTEPQVKPSRRKTKKEMNDEEYIKVCEKMAKLREARKSTADKPKTDKPVKEKEVIKYVDRPVEIIKEVVKEVVKEVSTKPKSNSVDLFGDTDELKAELKEVKTMLADMYKAKQAKRAAKELKSTPATNTPPTNTPPTNTPPAPVVKAPEPVKVKPQKVIYTGPMGMFRPF